MKYWMLDPLRLYNFGKGRTITKVDYRSTSVENNATNFYLLILIFHRKFLHIYYRKNYETLRNYFDDHDDHYVNIVFVSLVSKHTKKEWYGSMYLPEKSE